MQRLFKALLLLAELCLSFGLKKHWIADVDWQNPSNWLDGILPKTDDLIKFPLEMRHAVGMPRNGDFKILGMILTRDGVLALPENGKITINEAKDSKGRKPAYWLRDRPFFWVDPLNWNGTSEAVPHLERLPCQSDLAILPSRTRTFSIRLPVSREIEVSAVRLEDDNTSLSRWMWRDMSDRAEFIGDFSVRYSPLECKNCQCQEGDMSAYWEEVCNVQRPRCKLLACGKPLEVEGHCCFYCGGRIRLSKKTLLSTVKRVADEVLKKYKNTLFWHSRITWNGESEILITERGTYEGTNILIAISDIETALKGERAEILYIETSGGALKDYRLAHALGPVFGGLLVLLVLTLLLFPLFGYTFAQMWDGCKELGSAIRATQASNTGSKKKKKSFGFARFENAPEAGLQLIQETETRETFENPLYGPGRGRDTSLDLRQPVSLVALEQAIELDRMEDVEMDIENL